METDQQAKIMFQNVCVLTCGRDPLVADSQVLKGSLVPLKSFPIVVVLACE
jgi:hypothetical protein